MTETLAHEFVDLIPDDLKEGVVYVSIAYATAAHKCCCGCGKEVVTPLSPTDWKLIYDGKTLSLDPSIGNWSFPCQSHYWIRNDRVRWAPKWSPEMVEAGRMRDRFAKERYFGQADEANDAEPQAPSIVRSPGMWERFTKWFWRR